MSTNNINFVIIDKKYLSDTSIVILDEVTANVDPENEKKLQLAIEKLTHNKTVIMIAHRLKTVANADQILVVADGKIVQKGNHTGLMSSSGLYQDFVNPKNRAMGWKL